MEQLYRFIRNYVPLSVEDERFVSECFRVKHLQKNEYLVRKGTVCRHKWYCTKGIAKAVFLLENGEEKVIGFHLENTFFTQSESYEHEQPSPVSIQSITDMHVYELSKIDEQKLMGNTSYAKFLHSHLKHEYIQYQKTMRNITYLDGAERYNYLISYFPNILQYAKQKDVASFIGVSPERLSRIRHTFS